MNFFYIATCIIIGELIILSIPLVIIIFWKKPISIKAIKILTLFYCLFWTIIDIWYMHISGGEIDFYIILGAFIGTFLITLPVYFILKAVYKKRNLLVYPTEKIQESTIDSYESFFEPNKPQKPFDDLQLTKSKKIIGIMIILLITSVVFHIYEISTISELRNTVEYQAERIKTYKQTINSKTVSTESNYKKITVEDLDKITNGVKGNNDYTPQKYDPKTGKVVKIES